MFRRVQLRSLSDVGQRVVKSQQPENKGIRLFAGILGTVTFGLGVWQYRRWKQKLEFIENIEKTIKEVPVAIPADARNDTLSTLSSVFVDGDADFAYASLTTLRAAPDSLSNGAMSNPVPYTIVPVFRHDGTYALVVLGYMDAATVDTLRSQKIKLPVRVNGLMKRVDPPPTDVAGIPTAPYLNEQNVPIFPSLHPPSMAAYHGLIDPEKAVLVEAVSAHFMQSTVAPKVYCRTPRDIILVKTSPLTHVTYMATWFSLSGFMFLYAFNVIKGSGVRGRGRRV